jgi:hypothetical protein
MWLGILIMSASVIGLVIWIVYAMKGDKDKSSGSETKTGS